MGKIRTLIDTNIFIKTEDSSCVIPQDYAKFHRLAHQYCDVYLHPITQQDIGNDTNQRRKQEMLSRINKYYLLESPPKLTQPFLKKIACNEKNKNDMNDANLLYALDHDCASMLVTEDGGIHTKARMCGLEDRVYYLVEAIEKFQELYEKTKIELPYIKDVAVYTLDIDDSIFDSLKKDYPKYRQSPGFVEWFTKIKKEGRRAFVYFGSDKSIGGICIYKDEDGNGIYFKGKILKLCTFKVSEKARGEKIGELLIKNIFIYCLKNKYDGAYVTIFPKYVELISLLSDFGFSSHVSKKNMRGELAYIKDFRKPHIKDALKLNPLKFHSMHYPYFIAKKRENKYIIPIQPKYHDKLFPDYEPIQKEFFPRAGSEAFSNSIKKAYLCYSPIRKLKSGDLILFYRSGDIKTITTLGIVESIKITSDPNDVIAFAGKRTVFSFEDIKKLCQKPLLVILFRQIGHFYLGIRYSQLEKKKMIKNRVITITPISTKTFSKLLGDFSNECIFTN